MIVLRFIWLYFYLNLPVCVGIIALSIVMIGQKLGLIDVE